MFNIKMDTGTEKNSIGPIQRSKCFLSGIVGTVTESLSPHSLSLTITSLAFIVVNLVLFGDLLRYYLDPGLALICGGSIASFFVSSVFLYNSLTQPKQDIMLRLNFGFVLSVVWPIIVLTIVCNTRNCTTKAFAISFGTMLSVAYIYDTVRTYKAVKAAREPPKTNEEGNQDLPNWMPIKLPTTLKAEEEKLPV